MIKETMFHVYQQMLRSAWLSAKTDQGLHLLHEESLVLKLPTKQIGTTLIRMGKCPGCSE